MNGESSPTADFRILIMTQSEEDNHTQHIRHEFEGDKEFQELHSPDFFSRNLPAWNAAYSVAGSSIDLSVIIHFTYDMGYPVCVKITVSYHAWLCRPISPLIRCRGSI